MAGRSRIRRKVEWNAPQVSKRHDARRKPAITATSAKEKAEVQEQLRAKKMEQRKPARLIYPANTRRKKKDTPRVDAKGKRFTPAAPAPVKSEEKKEDDKN